MVKNLLPKQEPQEMQVPFLDRDDTPGGGNDNPLQYSCLENPTDREAWRAIVHRVTKELDTNDQLSTKHKTLDKLANLSVLDGDIPVYILLGCSENLLN